jgi:anti-sigma factor RsiW
MVCESWKTQLDTYLDGELPSEEMRAFDAHVRSCASCAADALARVQMKRSIQAAGKRFIPRAEFRRRLQDSIVTRPRRASVGWGWMITAGVLAMLFVVGLGVTYTERQRAGQEQQVYSELADLHVAALASASPVDVVSSDRHTVKPWFQGKIPFTFDLPELQNSEFSLLGGRITYLGQTPGAHLIYKLRKHEISVFIFQEGISPSMRDEHLAVTRKLSFNMETWSQGGLWYCILSDASAADVHELAELLKRSATS